MVEQGKKGLPEALERIEKAERSGEISLDLKDLGLEEIPIEISRLTNLALLSASGNLITAIPEWLTGLPNLVGISLADNRLLSVPESFASLENLKLLFLFMNQFESIPEPILMLRKLETLSIGANQIHAIPDSIWQMVELKDLSLWGNKVTGIPESVSCLLNLQSLDFSVNEITNIPESLSRLSNLKSLDLSRNRIKSIPESLSLLSSLQSLDLAHNELAAVPESISKLEKLEELDLNGNLIAAIPESLSSLKSLKKVDLSDNPMPDELLAAAERGADAFLRYLESIGTHAAHPRTVKLVLLGEPQAGKSTLLEALEGNPNPCDPARKETLGVNIAVVDKTSPEDGLALHLAVWDFAGQHIEHATHQPFLTENAVFLILWNARMGTGAGKRDLWYWLELLKMRVKEPKFLLVATHTELTPPDLNLTEIQRVYAGCQGSFAVEFSNLAGFGALEAKILELAAASQALSARWPPNWLPVRDRVREISATRPYMSSEEFRGLLEEQGVRDAQQQSDLAEQLHQLGEIPYLQGLGGSSGLVILSPAWLSELIARVVRSDRARGNRGLLYGKDLDELWRDANLTSEVREHLVRIMDQFDLTYSTVDAGEARIVVEALPYSTPEELEVGEMPGGQPEMEMIFRFPTLDRHLPPGIPTWGIARAHRLARPGVGPWRDAAFFEDVETDSRALILASDSAKEVRLRVKADYPPFFMGQLDAILRDTFRRYRELVPERRIPCRCHIGCTHSYEYGVVVGRRNSQKTYITCGISGDDVPLDTLLLGYSPTTQAGRLAEESERRRTFTSLMRAMNDQLEKNCPSVFTLAPSVGFRQLPTFWQSFTGAEELDLCLYCERDSDWHTTPESVYRFLPNKEWVEKLKAHWRPLTAVTLHVAPLAKAAGWAADIVALHAFGEAAESLHGANHPALSPLATELGQREAPQFVDIRVRAVLKELIDHQDAKRSPGARYGGLHPHIVEDGRLLWLCPDHYEAYRSK